MICGPEISLHGYIPRTKIRGGYYYGLVEVAPRPKICLHKLLVTRLTFTGYIISYIVFILCENGDNYEDEIELKSHMVSQKFKFNNRAVRYICGCRSLEQSSLITLSSKLQFLNMYMFMSYKGVEK
jgi:hypothetical protein